ncbi:MAG: hypothetical protein WA824_08840 [Candidatus Sulfotelmatobacter sp.]
MPSKVTAVFVCLIGLAVCLQPLPAAAQQLTLGTVATPTLLSTCPSSANFASGTTPAITCYSTNISGCSGVDTQDLVYGVATPTGALFGTIVMLAQGGGTMFMGDYATDYVQNYLNAHYQVIQVVWGGTGLNGSPGPQPWEVTKLSNLSPSNANIGLAACKPATFLNWVRNGNQGAPLGSGIWAGRGGMCAHGDSGGAGALGYALAWYNAGASTAAWGAGYLDKVVLENGPVFSDIDQGCEFQNGTNSQYTFVCEKSNQVGCNNLPPIVARGVSPAGLAIGRRSGPLASSAQCAKYCRALGQLALKVAASKQLRDKVALHPFLRVS